MNKLPPWNIPSTVPAVHDLESCSTLEMVSRLYGSMQSLITEWNEYREKANATIEQNDTELKAALQEFEHKFTCISNDLVQMVRDYGKVIENKITEAVEEKVGAGNIVEVYDPLTESLEIKVGGDKK